MPLIEGLYVVLAVKTFACTSYVWNALIFVFEFFGLVWLMCF